MIEDHDGLARKQGRLTLDGFGFTELAEQHGTPLHVVSARIIRTRVRELREAFADYPAPVRLHFSYKTNLVAGVLRVLHAAGVYGEVVGGFEHQLARRLGLAGRDIVWNGPYKTDAELRDAVEGDVGLLVLDGRSEIRRLQHIAADAGRRVRVALRLCPDIAPRGLNASAVTGSRRSQFGFDLRSGEAMIALREVLASPNLELRGLHAHIGSGIHDLAAFTGMARRLMGFYAVARAAGAPVDTLDLGGGLGTRHSREFRSLEFLAYLGLGRMPRRRPAAAPDHFARYGAAVTRTVMRAAAELRVPLPELVLEPGRALVSDAQFLLLRVGAIRERAGIGRCAITDGGAMTVSMMFLSEYHEVLLANRTAPAAGTTSIFGRLPSPMDVVYRNLPSPRLEEGDLLAVADAGAYFTSTSTNFGGERPAVVLIDDDAAHLVRRRETFDDLVQTELALAGAVPTLRIAHRTAAR